MRKGKTDEIESRNLFNNRKTGHAGGRPTWQNREPGFVPEVEATHPGFPACFWRIGRAHPVLSLISASSPRRRRARERESVTRCRALPFPPGWHLAKAGWGCGCVWGFLAAARPFASSCWMENGECERYIPWTISRRFVASRWIRQPGPTPFLPLCRVGDVDGMRWREGKG